MKELLKKVIDGEVESIDITMTPICEIEDLLKSNFGAEDLELMGDETNGWQVDFWYYFELPEGRFMLSGSLHYGNFKFSKVKE